MESLTVHYSIIRTRKYLVIDKKTAIISWFVYQLGKLKNSISFQIRFNIIPYRKRIFVDTVSTNKKYAVDTVSTNKKYAVDTVFTNKKFVVGTLPSNKNAANWTWQHAVKNKGGTHPQCYQMYRQTRGDAPTM